MSYTYQTMVRDTSEDAMYTFAEVKYGKIVSINKHWVPLEEYKKFFEPTALFLDITGVLIDGEEPKVGDTVNSGGDTGYTIVHIPDTYDIFDVQKRKVEEFKLIRDTKELEPIEYNDILFDADRVSQERMDKARKFLEDNNMPSITWTTADNQRVDIGVADFKGINTQIAIRSNELHIRYNQLKAYVNALTEEYTQLAVDMDWDWDMTIDKDAYMEEVEARYQAELAAEAE